MQWVFGLLPAHRPSADEFTTTDFPEAVDVARRILADPAGGTVDMAGRMHDRPTWQRGRSFNPNTCHHCGHHAEWHDLDDVTNHAFYGSWYIAAEGRVSVAEWRAIRGQGQGVAWPGPL
ncbi:hypothetical protein ACF08M_38630 [Streptomyces sp. NPDC015032]|uniref:hypothetical protein n=1 Tax=Streptomyces sp. NPDC015032 TaxID=3364937 RepID=UPI0036FE600E